MRNLSWAQFRFLYLMRTLRNLCQYEEVPSPSETMAYLDLEEIVLPPLPGETFAKPTGKRERSLSLDGRGLEPAPYSIRG